MSRFRERSLLDEEIILAKRYSLIAFLTLVLWAALGPIVKPLAQVGSPSAPQRPKLVVELVIDQFPYDYLVRFRPYFVAGGFKLLMSGANFVNCRYDDATTVTGAGHASLATGAYPDLHGIIGNQWYDRELHRQVYCVEDDSTRMVGGEGPGRSPHFLLGNTLGDQMRLDSGFKSRVVSVSLKDRAAILMGGHLANAVYWYDFETGKFVSSTYYMASLPPWVKQFNAQQSASSYCGKSWQALAETPEAPGEVLSAPPASSSEPCPDPQFLTWLEKTPYMNRMELEFALATLKNERLGQGSATDLLAVSLSVNDLIGHAYGPYSSQVADTTLRTDRDLAGFFKALDEIIGLGNVWITLSADHGVAPNPGFITQHHLGVGHAPMALVQEAVERALSAKYGQDHWIEGVGEFELYLNQGTLGKHGLEAPLAESLAAQAATGIPGVSTAFTKSQVMAGDVPRTPIGRKVSHSFFPRRSGDLFIVFDPYAVPVTGDVETTHGSPWNYDAQVPLLLWGSEFKPGAYASACEPVDLAPTLAVALGISQPSVAQGTPLATALK